ncbi:DUF1015 family protein [Streptomyces radicis]|uniref:DUF1015 domain-containing protein n=1 Tax=Streptomyces radicis TaxID=1750517 RepID=A0A3A9VTF5_9ACTN|nr:DUF1015 domain-containing protein [Streptomyces radicis]RKN04020.1 DUF1015 domain-containing protein [Streptomyces radicis]RKN14194.1 DUF1015 domain-containing protein [Streptomyces radicis]
MHAAGLDLAPFRALRYAPERVGSLAAVTSPPYDVVVRPDGQHALETADPFNIVRLILPRATDQGTAHRGAAETLRRWRADGVLTEEPRPALYVYEQRAGATLQRGVLGALRLTRPGEGVVLPHEDVLPEVVAERADLMRATAANLEPLLLSYRGGPSGLTASLTERAAARPPLLATTTADGVHHRVWSLTDPAELAAVRDDLAGHRALIADGHHRWATCLRLAAEHGGRPPWDRGLVLLVDTDRHPLRVGAIHRVLPGVAPATALAALGAICRVTPLPGALPDALAALERAEGNAFLLAGADAFHLLDRPDPALLTRAVRGDRPAAWRALDATVLHEALLPALGPNAPAPAAVRHLHDAATAVALAERGGGTAILLRAVPEATVRALAEQGVTMPQKSTSFGPKPATGLLLRDLTLGDRI